MGNEPTEREIRKVIQGFGERCMTDSWELQVYHAMRDLYLERQTTLADAEVGDEVKFSYWFDRFSVEDKREYLALLDYAQDGRSDPRRMPLDTPCTIVERAVTFGDLGDEQRHRIPDKPNTVFTKVGERTAAYTTREHGTVGSIEIYTIDVDPDTEVEPAEDA